MKHNTSLLVSTPANRVLPAVRRIMAFGAAARRRLQCTSLHGVRAFLVAQSAIRLLYTVCRASHRLSKQERNADLKTLPV